MNGFKIQLISAILVFAYVIVAQMLDQKAAKIYFFVINIRKYY